MAYRNVLLVIHISCAAAWLGANLTQLMLTPWFVRRGGEAAAVWFEATTVLAKRYYNVAGVILAISGILLVQETGYDWSAGFVAVGIVVIAIGAVTGITFFAKEGERLTNPQVAGDPAESRRYRGVALLDTCLVLIAILAMVSRWQA